MLPKSKRFLTESTKNTELREEGIKNLGTFVGSVNFVREILEVSHRVHKGHREKKRNWGPL